MLYIILRHPSDPNGKWKNTWDGLSVINAITTNEELADICIAEKQRNQKVAIYRCAYGGSSAAICCLAEIDQAVSDPETSFITFKNQEILAGVTPPRPANTKENYYFEADVASSKAA